MSCMKCGKDTEDGQAFCAHCLEGMEAYPVKPDAHIQLPNHSTEENNKKPPRKKRDGRKSTVCGLKTGWGKRRGGSAQPFFSGSRTPSKQALR